MADLSTQFQELIRDAVDTDSRINFIGGGSKAFYGREPQGESIDVAANSGIIDYLPTELVITVRGGTQISEIQTVLDEHNQMLGFEPPCLNEQSTIAGVIAVGLSGSRRPFSGAVRDYILGCKIINGYAEILSFGGTTMKNVAGYDLSRLMAGSMGTLGLMLEMSLKVIPRPEQEATWFIEVATDQVIATMADLLAKSIPFSGMFYDGRRLFYRLSGADDAINQIAESIGGEQLVDHELFWEGVNHHTHDYFQDETPLWRISVPPATQPVSLAGQFAYDWGGALRWLKSEEVDSQVFQVIGDIGGHATLFRHGQHRDAVFQPLPEHLMQIQRRLKHAFDPKGLFNPGRLYPEF
ncbi:MAG: glycolate oxidase subunit GlcE [Gammaproteobacteria bacterium]|nr:glycolate oxidase subunit GlcE [Gammaproteobacteria bacterium]